MRIVIFVLLLCSQLAFSQDLVIGIKDSKPFVDSTQTINGDADTPSQKGISVELWELIAKYRGWSYTYKQYQSIDDLIAATETGEVDVAVSPISSSISRAGRRSVTASRTWVVSTMTTWT